jgi:hypothetical protein
VTRQRGSDLPAHVRAESETVETALVSLDREQLRARGFDPDAVVTHLFSDGFVAANTDFPSLAAFLEEAGVETVWGFERWLGWVLDWHVLGNTRFWSWEWMVHAAVALAADAARVGPVRCEACSGPVSAVTGSAIEEPGRADTAWVDYECACGASGRAEIREPEGGVRLSGSLAWASAEGRLPAVRDTDGE